MTGFVDLHCHWVSGIDDGAREPSEGLEILRGLGGLGFSHVVATPHIRPGMFDNDAAKLSQAFTKMLPFVGSDQALPKVSLGAEHFFDADVLARIKRGEGFPYREGHNVSLPRLSGALLLEFLDLAPLSVIESQLFQLQASGYITVLAHPERYRAVWEDPAIVLRLVELGSVALLDSCALVGKYGRRSEKAAKALLAEGVYDAACSDAHRPSDVALVEKSMAYIHKEYGPVELDFLFDQSPSRLLLGQRPVPR